jgi:hypothetical protein
MATTHTVNENVTVKFVVNEKGNPPEKARRRRTALQRRRARRPEAHWLRSLGAPIRRRPERDVIDPTLTVRIQGAVPRLAPPARRKPVSNPAQRVIAKFGGQCALARLLGRRQSTVQHWANRGYIPEHWHEKLLNLARQRTVPLKQEELAECSVREQHRGDYGPTGRCRIPENSSVSRTLMVGLGSLHRPTRTLSTADRCRCRRRHRSTPR